MAVQKKSLIASRDAAKKANLASKKTAPVVTEGQTQGRATARAVNRAVSRSMSRSVSRQMSRTVSNLT